MKRKIRGKYHVYSHSGKHMGGPYDTEAEANERLRQIDAAKHAKKGGLSEHKRKKGPALK